MRIRFAAQGVAAPPVRAAAERGIRAVLRRGRVRGKGELNVVWVTRRRLRELGRRFLRADHFTDVISFRYDEGDAFGDLYVSPEQARVNAERFGASHAEECLRLCVHGALHLLGYTDHDPAEKARMWKVQEAVVRRALKG